MRYIQSSHWRFSRDRIKTRKQHVSVSLPGDTSSPSLSLPEGW